MMKHYHICEKACTLEPNYSVAHYRKARSLYKLNRFEESLTEYQLCLKLDENGAQLSPNETKYVQKQIDLLINRVGNQSISQTKQNHDSESLTKTREATPVKPDSNDEKGMLVTEENISKFGRMSIMDQIDEILAQMIQIEEIIDENDNGNIPMNKRKIKEHLLDVQNKLGEVRAKCNKGETSKNIEMGKSLGNGNVVHGYNYSDLKSQLKKLRTEIANGSDKSPLSVLVELKQLEQDSKVQHQKIEVLIVQFVDLFFDLLVVQ